jgi:hypothetical protein
MIRKKCFSFLNYFFFCLVKKFFHFYQTIAINYKSIWLWLFSMFFSLLDVLFGIFHALLIFSFRIICWSSIQKCLKLHLLTNFQLSINNLGINNNGLICLSVLEVNWCNLEVVLLFVLLHLFKIEFNLINKFQYIFDILLFSNLWF